MKSRTPQISYKKAARIAQTNAAARGYMSDEEYDLITGRLAGTWAQAWSHDGTRRLWVFIPAKD